VNQFETFSDIRNFLVSAFRALAVPYAGTTGLDPLKA
jgi:hypothetical protein